MNFIFLKNPNEFWLEIRVEFPTISEMVLNKTAVLYYALAQSGVLSIENYEIKIFNHSQQMFHIQ